MLTVLLARPVENHLPTISTLHYLAFCQFSLECTTLSATLIDMTDRGEGKNYSVCLVQHWINQQDSKWQNEGQSTVFCSTMTSRVLDSVRWTNPLKPSRFTLQSQVLFYLSFYIDLSAWRETLLQVQQDILAVAQILPWPKGESSTSGTTLDSKLGLTQNAFQGQDGMLITSDKIRDKCLTTFV